MNRLRYIRPLLIAVLLSASTLSGHHAKEYLRTESYAQAPKHGLIFFNGFDSFKPHFNRSTGESWEYTPTLTYGFSDRLMINLHTHLLHIQSHAPFFEAGALGLQYQISRPGTWPIDMGLSVEYELPFRQSRTLINGKQIFNTTLILSKELPGDINITGNLSYTKETKYGSHDEFSMAMGLKGHPIPQLDWLESGIEMLGTPGTHPTVTLVPGLYAALNESVIIKAGASLGLNQHTDDLGLHVVAAYIF